MVSKRNQFAIAGAILAGAAFIICIFIALDRTGLMFMTTPETQTQGPLSHALGLQKPVKKAVRNAFHKCEPGLAKFGTTIGSMDNLDYKPDVVKLQGMCRTLENCFNETGVEPTRCRTSEDDIPWAFQVCCDIVDAAAIKHEVSKICWEVFFAENAMDLSKCKWSLFRFD